MQGKERRKRQRQKWRGSTEVGCMDLVVVSGGAAAGGGGGSCYNQLSRLTS